jgi:hypothetical protein
MIRINNIMLTQLGSHLVVYVSELFLRLATTFIFPLTLTFIVNFSTFLHILLVNLTLT